MGNNTSAFQKDVIGDLYYNKKLTLQRIGDKFGITKERVRQKMEQWGMPRKNNGKTIRSQKICEEYEKGVSISQLAKEHNVTQSQIKWIIRTYSKAYQERQKKKMQERNRRDSLICYYYENGMTQSEIAEKFNLYQPAVSVIVRNRGYKKGRLSSQGKFRHCQCIMSQDLHESLKQYAKKRKCSVSGAVGQLIRKHLTRNCCLDIVQINSNKQVPSGFTLSPEEYSILEDWTKKMNLSKGATVRSLVNRYVGKNGRRK